MANNRLQELQKLVESFKTDFEKFYHRSNKAAGVRVRKHMAVLKRKAQEIRDEVQEVKKNITTKAADAEGAKDAKEKAQ